MASTTSTAENLPTTPRSQNLSNGAFEAMATSGTNFKGRVAFSMGTFKIKEEKDAMQEISNPQDSNFQKIANSNGDDPNPVVQKDKKKMRSKLGEIEFKFKILSQTSPRHQSLKRENKGNWLV